MSGESFVSFDSLSLCLELFFLSSYSELINAIKNEDIK